MYFSILSFLSMKFKTYSINYEVENRMKNNIGPALFKDAIVKTKVLQNR